MSKYHGEGEHTNSKGEYYKGYFENGLKHGKGEWRESVNEGDVYIGNYFKGKRHGYGEYFCSDSGCVSKDYYSNGIRLRNRNKKSLN